MNRDDYLRQLKLNLYGLSTEEIEDIILDYEEHFQIGLSKGKSEEEISSELGNPRDIASNYISQSSNGFRKEASPVNHNDNARKVLLIILLAFFNLIIVLGPYLGLLGIVLGIFGLGMGLFFGGIGIIFGAPFAYLGSFADLHLLTVFGFSVGFVGLGILAFILGIYLVKLIYRLTLKYIKWNIDIINNRRSI